MPDILDPRTPGQSVSPYPPELQGEAAALHRRRALADMLLLRSMQPLQQPTGYGGIPVPISPFAGLAHIAQAGIGGLAGRGMDRGEAELANRYSEGMQGATQQVTDLMKTGDFAGASQVAARWPALKAISEKLLERQMPQNVIHDLTGSTGQPQPNIINLNEPNAPPTPLGLPKSPTYHPVETASPSGQPQTSFVDLTKPPEGPLPKPAALHAAGLGGTTDLYNPYGPERTLKHTLDPNRTPTPEDMEADAKMIAEYRKPGYGSAGGRMAPWQVNTMRRVDEMLGGKYQTSIYPIVKAAEMEFNQRNAPQVRQFGTFVGHVKAIKDLYAALENPTDVTRINQARNFFLEEFGYPAPAAIDTARPFLAGEAVKAVTGGPGAVEDRKAIADRFSKAQSPAAFNAAADTALQFGAEQLKGHLQQLKGMTKGMRGEAEFSSFLTPSAREVFLKYGGSLNAGRRAGDQGGLQLPDVNAIDAELARRKAAGG